MAKKPHNAEKRKRVRFKARHPEGRHEFAKRKRAKRKEKRLAKRLVRKIKKHDQKRKGVFERI